jgi:hypothetical protein
MFQFAFVPDKEEVEVELDEVTCLGNVSTALPQAPVLVGLESCGCIMFGLGSAEMYPTSSIELCQVTGGIGIVEGAGGC